MLPAKRAAHASGRGVEGCREFEQEVVVVGAGPLKVWERAGAKQGVGKPLLVPAQVTLQGGLEKRGRWGTSVWEDGRADRE